MIRKLADGLVVVGTAHVSARSVADVEDTIRREKPARVLIELDARRFEALRDAERWQNTDIVQVLREKKQHLFLLQLYLANMQARIGRETGVSPGSEMMRAVEVADEIGAEVVLIDRDVGITLRRGFGAMGFLQRLRLFWNVWSEVLTPTKRDGEGPLDVDAMLETDAITAMTEEFAAFAPEIKTALIDERDTYMATHIHEQHRRHGTVVAVVGAGHLPGIERRLAVPDALPFRYHLDKEPDKRFPVGKLIAWVVPLAIIGAFVALLLQGETEAFRQAIIWWIVINGGLSALGAAIALGHPLSILVAFVAAPITSVNPTLAAGWFAGLTEAKVRTPKVRDFEAIQAIESFKDFWRNGVVRIILVTALANVGSSIGTFIAGTKTFELLLGGG